MRYPFPNLPPLGRLGTWLGLLLLGYQPGLHAQKVIPLGGGSYAEYPPLWEAAKPGYANAPGHPDITDSWGDLSQTLVRKKWNIVDSSSRPVPTTDWWTSLVSQDQTSGGNYSGNLWAYPGMVNATSTGLCVEFPKTWQVAADGNTAKLVSSSRLTIGGQDFTPRRALARRWGAWTLDWIMPDATDPSRQLAVTIGHGLPFTWVECTKVTPTITVDGATFFNDGGQPLTLPFTGDHLGISTKGDQYGIFAPPNTQFTLAGNVLTVKFPGANGYVVVGTLTKVADLATFNTYAYTVPRDSKVSWAYDEASAKMTSTWELVNENLRGGPQLNQIQGWLPHSYRKTTRGFAFNGLEYATPRGVLKCAVGTKFTVSYDFNGLLPGYTTPEVLAGSKHPYRPEVMKQMIDEYKTVSGYGNDTYWGGKDLLNYARYMQVAAQTGNTEAFTNFKKKTRDALTDWLTYTPGESAHFFSLYPNVGSFLGHRTRDNGNPGIEVLQDHAFCYGYHVYAAALLMLYDEDFKTKYQDIVKLLVLDYANYNRADRRFTYFRSFDPWAGHSYSGGLGTGDGNGEESSSEGMQAWSAMYLLGEVTGDKAMRNAAIFGYTQEAQGVAEYWFDRAHIPANGGQGNYDYTKWPRDYNSNLQSNGIGWWTFFDQNPFWMHSIQWLPMSPALKYLYEDVPFARWDWDHMWQEKTQTGWDGEFGNSVVSTNVGLSYMQISLPDSAAAIFDNLWNNKRTGVYGARENNAFTYWYTQSHLTLGEIQWNQHTNLPSSTVYFNAKLNQTTVVVYNPSATETTVNVYKDGAQYASFTAPAKQLIAYKFDAKLTTLQVTAPAKAVAPTKTLQLTAQPYDQYGAKVSTPVTWAVTGGGSISATGLYTAGSTVGTVVVTATAGAVKTTYSLRVNAASVLTTIAVKGTPARADIGQTYQLTATGLDQYSDTLTIAPTWTLSGGGSVTSAGLLAATTPGTGFILKVTAGGVSKSLALSVSYPLSNIALGKPATASTTNPGNPLPGLNDGSLSTRWESADQNAQWVTIDLGSVFDLEKVVLNWEAAYADAYTLQVSTDGSTFAPLAAQTAGTGGREELAVAGTGRYLKLNLTHRGSVWQYSLLEVEAYGLPQKTGGAVLSTIRISPTTVTMKDNVIQQFTLQGYDQYGQLLAVTPTWAVIGKGSISASGLYTPSGGGLYNMPAFTVTAVANNLTAKATVVVEETTKLTKLDIQPLSSATKRLEMALGSTRPLTTAGLDQFGTPYAGPLTWTVSGGGTVTADGTFTATQLGDWLVIAKNGAVSDTAYITVKPFADVNLATFKPVKTSSVESDDANQAGQYAVDRNLGTRWASKWTDSEYLYVDLQAAYKLNKVVVNWQNRAATYDIQVSGTGAAGSWTTVASVTSTGATDVVPFPETVGRYVQLLGRTRSNGYGYAVFEFQVYGTGVAGATNQAPTVAITSPAANATFTGLGAIPLTVSAADADGSVATVEYYAGSSLVATTTTAPFGATWTPAATGAYALTAKATDNQGSTTTSAAVNVTVSAAPTSGLTIPGKIEAETFTAMSGIAAEPTADAGGGQNIGYLDVGDWLDYQVSVQAAGPYSAQFRVAGWNAGAQLQLRLGATVLATASVPTTANGQTFATTPAVSVILPAGSQTLRVAITGGGFNLNWMSFAQGAAARVSSPLATQAASAEYYFGYPNPADQVYYLEGVAEGIPVVVTGLAGNQVATLTVRNGALDVHGLATGLYLLRVADGTQVRQLKMLKK
ncbi:MAG: glycosyl hydrolase [Janthinobacterium lividum]